MKVLLTLLGAVCLAAPSVMADDASKTAKIHELFTLTHADQIQRQTMQQMRAMMRSQIADAVGKDAPPETAQAAMHEIDGVMDVAEKHTSWAALEPGLVKVYE